MNNVALGLSGGVDSAAAAVRLKNAGYEVEGVFLLMGSEEGIEDARKTAEKLKISFQILDVSELFENEVKKYFISEYTQGRTPNPCVKCNPTVKIQSLLTLGTDYIATGHYAGKGEENGKYFIRRSKIKDQSYMLSRLSQPQIKKILFPLFDTDKEENRRIAYGNGLPPANKKDSQDICFISDGDNGGFFERSGVTSEPGEFFLGGKPVGQHRGIIHYTVGQRKNLGISLGAPAYIERISPEENRVYLSFDDPMKESLRLSDIVYQLGTGNETATVKIRYAHKGAEALCSNGGRNIRFGTPQRAVTPGQTAVAYTDDGKILFSGIIE